MQVQIDPWFVMVAIVMLAGLAVRAVEVAAQIQRHRLQMLQLQMQAQEKAQQTEKPHRDQARQGAQATKLKPPVAAMQPEPPLPEPELVAIQMLAQAQQAVDAMDVQF